MSDLEKLELKAKWFDYLSSRLNYAQLDLSFGGRHKIYHESKSAESLIEELEQAVGFENCDEKAEG